MKDEKKIEVSEAEFNSLIEMKTKYLKNKAINEKSYRQRNAKIKLMCDKANEVGIEVSEKEINEYLKNKK